jgi:hypothetical protein
LILEHEPVILAITGSIDNFREGSERRQIFVSSLASILAILESQIVIVSVKSGSIIVELAFLRESNSTASPSETTLRLKNAHLEGKLGPLGALDLNIGGQSINPPSSSPVSLPLVIGSSASALVVAFCIVLLAIKYKRYLRQKLNQNEAPPAPSAPSISQFEMTPLPVLVLHDISVLPRDAPEGHVLAPYYASAALTVMPAVLSAPSLTSPCFVEPRSDDTVVGIQTSTLRRSADDGGLC